MSVDPWKPHLTAFKRSLTAVLGSPKTSTSSENGGDTNAKVTLSDGDGRLVAICEQFDTLLSLGLMSARERRHAERRRRQSAVDSDTDSDDNTAGRGVDPALNGVGGGGGDGLLGALSAAVVSGLRYVTGTVDDTPYAVMLCLRDAIDYDSIMQGGPVAEVARVRGILDSLRRDADGLSWAKADSPTGRWRLLVRACLSRGALGDLVATLRRHDMIAARYYHRRAAVVRNEAPAEVLMSLCRTLAATTTIDVDLRNAHFLADSWRVGRRCSVELVPTTDRFGMGVEYVEDEATDGRTRHTLVTSILPNSVASHYAPKLDVGDILDEVNGETTKRCSPPFIARHFKTGQRLPVRVSVVKPLVAASLNDSDRLGGAGSDGGDGGATERLELFPPVAAVWRRSRHFAHYDGQPPLWRQRVNGGRRRDDKRDEDEDELRDLPCDLPPEALLSEFRSYRSPVLPGGDDVSGRDSASYVAFYITSVSVDVDRGIRRLTKELVAVATRHAAQLERTASVGGGVGGERSGTASGNAGGVYQPSSLTSRQVLAAHKLPTDRSCLVRLGETGITVVAKNDDEAGGDLSGGMVEREEILLTAAYVDVSCTGKCDAPRYFALTSRERPGGAPIGANGVKEDHDRFVCHMFRALRDDDATKIVYTVAQGFERTHWLF